MLFFDHPHLSAAPNLEKISQVSYEASKQPGYSHCLILKALKDHSLFWGLTDGDSWKNGWPMAGRTDYPLAIDRNYNPKPFVEEIIKLVK